jgi:hypothetical protein
MNRHTTGVGRPLAPIQTPEGRTRENVLLRAPMMSTRPLSLLYPVSSTIRWRLRTR